jgi:hypothetical protein
LLSPDILKALRTALKQVLDEEAAKSEQFKRVLENWRAFRAEQHRWFLIADARTEMSVYALTTARPINKTLGRKAINASTTVRSKVRWSKETNSV